MFGIDESIENLGRELDLLLGEYEKKTKLHLKNEILSIVKTNAENNFRCTSKYRITAGDKNNWINSNELGLYFSMTLSFRKHTSGKVDLILVGDLVDSYMTCMDTGVRIEQVHISIPVNYKPGIVQNLINGFSLLLK